MAVVDEEKQAAIYELKTKFDTNNAKLKQACFSPPFFLISGKTALPITAADAGQLLTLFTFSSSQLESQKRQNEITLRRAAFTASHLDELPDDVATYRSIGKAYFLEPKAAMMSHLQEVVERADRELKAASTSKEGLVAAQEGFAKELNELLGAGKKK
jgi:chaperonin cofactor prefoldin